MKTFIRYWFLIAAAAILTVAVVQQITPAHAQNPALTPYQFSVSNVTHTSCTVLASTTQYCYASDGPYVSINGAAYVSMLPTSSSPVTVTPPLTITNGNIALGTTGLKTLIDGLGLQAAAAPVQ
jgi:hypothetical protein